MMSDMHTRRRFFKHSAKAAAAAAMTSFSGRSILGANDRIRIAGIGCGDRGTDRLAMAQRLGAEIVALADVNDAMLDRCEKSLGVKVRRFRNYPDLLALDAVDAVINATPDHWHRDVLLDAVKAGKDVYTEKPLARTIDEGLDIVKAVKASDRIVQVGNQRRSGEHWARAHDLVKAGKIGPVRFVRTWDCRYRLVDPYQARANDKSLYDPARIDWDLFLGRAPKRPFDAQRCSAWRWFWDYAGGLMTDIGPHMLDVAHWITDTLGPKSVVCNGGNYHYQGWETPDNVHAILDCGSFAIVFSVQFMNGYDSDGAAFYGTEGTILQCPDGKFRRFDIKNRELESWEMTNDGRDHMQNFLDCIKSRKQPNSPAETGHRVLTGAHLANIAYREGKMVRWDVETQAIVDRHY
jgi:predicted dehydrogenase